MSVDVAEAGPRSASPGSAEQGPRRAGDAQYAGACAASDAQPADAARAGAVAAGGGLTYDQALAQYVGECGRGQALNFVLASTLWVPNAALILLLVFALGSPVRDGLWQCTDGGDAACRAVLEAADPAAGFCGLARSQWSWTQRSAGLVSQFDLVCGGAHACLGAG
jgi:hypothetical protein